MKILWEQRALINSDSAPKMSAISSELNILFLLVGWNIYFSCKQQKNDEE